MITYIIVALLVAWIANLYGMSGTLWFICSLIFTPFIVGFILFLKIVLF